MNNYCINFLEIGNEVSLMNRGTVEKIQIETGLNMRVWNLNFAQTVTISKAAEPIQSQFYLLYILTPETISLAIIDQHLQYNNTRERHALLIPGSVQVQFNVRAHQPVQLIEFDLAAWWLKELMTTRKRQDEYAALCGDTGGNTTYVESGSWQMNMNAADLFRQILAGGIEPAQVLQGSTALITAFIEKVFCKRGYIDGRVKDIYLGKMEEAEKVLMQYLRNTLPNLSQIARQLAISESTLKRHFKLVYGKSIYGYYLARKMELARQLLEENTSSVNEMAELLGYEKVSYFIEIFKKYHGFSPGAIRKRLKSA